MHLPAYACPGQLARNFGAKGFFRPPESRVHRHAPPVFVARFASMLFVLAAALWTASPAQTQYASMQEGSADAMSAASVSEQEPQAGYTGLSLKSAAPLEDMTPKYLEGVPGMEDRASSFSSAMSYAAQFSDLATTGPLANLSLRLCAELAVENNLSLVNSRRDLEISKSSLREAEAFFIPFVDLVGTSSYRETRTDWKDTPLRDGETHRITQNAQSGKVQAGVNLPSGGSVSASAGPERTRSTSGSGPGGGSLTYENSGELRLDQPLLRGAGFDVGTANLRSSRLSQISQQITYRLAERNTVLTVVQQYFRLLQAAQDLRVSREAIAEKHRFLEETRVRYEKGRVAESAILRAELQVLQEEESAVRLRQTFNDRLENLALTLGLEPGTSLSVQDVTADLARRGRVKIPSLEEAITVGMSHRLELLQSQISIEQAAISLAVARKNVLPDLNFTAGASTSDTDRTLGGSTDFEDNAWDTGLELRIPLPNIGRREALRRAALSLDKSRTNRLSRERDITQEIKSAHRAVKTSESGLAILERTVEQARKNLELVNGQFEVGFVTILDVRQAQDDLFANESSLNTTLLNYQISIAQLYVALGQPLI